MSKLSSNLRWGVEKRLEFIEFRLFWEKTLNRSDLINFFGISVPQASKDLSLYQEQAPGNMEYDKSDKHYLATKNFSPKFFTPDADQYLSQLRLIGEHIETADTFWASSIPDIGCMPIPHRRVHPVILRTILNAITEKQSVEILYQSMNPKKTEPEFREISPLTFGHDGLRWHIRAFCHQENTFKDFLLSRCLEVKVVSKAAVSIEEDLEWQKIIEVKLIPNPALSLSQQRVIATDYEMKNNELSISMRAALLYYFEKRLRLDVAKALDKPQEAPVVIANQNEVDKILKRPLSYK